MLNFAHICCNHSQDETTSLFYANSEKILFLICEPDNLSEPKILAKSLKACAKSFSKIASVSKNEVQTLVVGKSKNYQNRRVFYATTTSIPKGALELKSKAWTMLEFLKY
jgi:hypothetical protein